MDIEHRVCKKHGITEFTFSSYDNKWKCKKCSIDSITKRRRELKYKLVEYKGGRCEKCGYDKCIDALEFHHLDENEKSFGISNGNVKSFEKAKEEVDKCILVCSNCHKEIHYELKLKKEEEKLKLIENNILEYKKNCNEIGHKPYGNLYILQENIDDIKNDIISGLSQKDISIKYNISVSTLKRFLTKNNLNNVSNHRSNKLKNYTIKEFINDAKQFNCIKSEIANKKGVRVLAIDEWCVKNNIPYKKKDLLDYINNN